MNDPKLLDDLRRNHESVNRVRGLARHGATIYSRAMDAIERLGAFLDGVGIRIADLEAEIERLREPEKPTRKTKP